MKKIFYLFIILLTLPIFSNAQRWRAERVSVVYGQGMTHFMGDLGGGKKDAAHFFGVRDLDFVKTGTTVQAGIRYRMTEALAVKPTLTYLFLRGDDAASGSVGRESRNLSFRSHVWEFGTQFEYAFLKEKENPRYSFSSLKAMRNISMFAILGGGVLYYNPKTKLDGKWIALRPLHTEGQGQESFYYQPPMIDGIVPDSVKVTPDSEYKKIAFQITLGLGVKYNISRRWAIGMEITNRYTSTDYLDDAHDRYYNYAEMGTTAPSDYNYLLADRHVAADANSTAEKYPSGKPMRGNPKYNDAYILTVINVHYKLHSSIKGLPKF